MTVTNINVKPIEGLPRLKAYAMIVLDNQLAINEIKIIKANNGLCIEFPKDKYTKLKSKSSETIAPLNLKTRCYIQSLVLQAYQLGCDYFLVNKGVYL